MSERGPEIYQGVAVDFVFGLLLMNFARRSILAVKNLDYE